MAKRKDGNPETLYKSVWYNRGGSDLQIRPYTFNLEFYALDDIDALDTVAAIGDGRGLVQPPPGTWFELARLQDGRGRVVNLP